MSAMGYDGNCYMQINLTADSEGNQKTQLMESQLGK